MASNWLVSRACNRIPPTPDIATASRRMAAWVVAGLAMASVYHGLLYALGCTYPWLTFFLTGADNPAPAGNARLPMRWFWLVYCPLFAWVALNCIIHRYGEGWLYLDRMHRMNLRQTAYQTLRTPTAHCSCICLMPFARWACTH